MKRIIIFSSVLMFFLGCGGGGNSPTPNNNPTTNQDNLPNHNPPIINPPNHDMQTPPQNPPNQNEKNEEASPSPIFPVVIPNEKTIEISQFSKDDFKNQNLNTSNNFQKLYSLNFITQKTARTTQQGTSSDYFEKDSSVGFSKNWNQGYHGKDIILAVIDTGTDDLTNVVKNEHYEYKEGGIEYYWRPPENRMDENNFTKKDFDNSCIQTQNGCKIESNSEIHGKNVMSVANTIAKQLKFANIVDKSLNNSIANNGFNEAATIDALSNQGIRFFNRSVALMSDVNHSISQPGNYAIAILKNNALVVNAAGNGDSKTGADTKGDFTNNALPKNSPLRKGWIIASGYSTDIPKNGEPKNAYYVTGETGLKTYINHVGDTCKKYGWDDCISAPFRVGNLQGTSFSAPIVLSTAALVYEKYPWMSNENLKDVLFSTVYEVKAKEDVLKSFYTNEFLGKNQAQSDEIIATKIKERFGVGVLNPQKAMNGPAKFDKDFVANVDISNIYVFDNNISGEGGLIKQGIGTLALFGNNNFTGDINIKQGTLWLVDYRLNPIIDESANEPSIYQNIKNEDILRITSGANPITIKNLTNDGVFINEGVKVDKLNLTENSTIYSNLGESLSVFSSANLNGDFIIIGIKNFLSQNNYKILELKNKEAKIEGQFKNVNSLSAFITINNVNYDNNGVSVDVSIKNPEEIKSIDKIAQNNFKEYFDSIQKRLDYEKNKHNKEITKELASIYNLEGLYGNLNAQDFENYRVALMFDDIINTKPNEILRLNKKMFGNDFYDNILLNLSKIKRINAINSLDSFNIKQSYVKSKINDLKEHSNQTAIFNGFDFKNYHFGGSFIFEESNAKNSDFNTISKSYATNLDFKLYLSDIIFENIFSFFYIQNSSTRFLNTANFKTKAFANSLKISKEVDSKYGSFIPFIGFLGINYNQDKFSEKNTDYAISLKDFKKTFFYANAGIKYAKKFGNFDILAGFDSEYNFNHFELFGENNLVKNNFKIKKNKNQVLIKNYFVNANYQVKNGLGFNLSYQGSYAKDYAIYGISGGFSYSF